MAVSEVTRTSERGRAWVTLIAAYAGCTIFTSAYYMIGVFYVELLDHYGEDPVKTALVGSLNTALLCLLGPFVGVLINMFSCRTVVVTGALVVSSASFISSFVPSIDWLILTYGVLGGTGGALTAVPISVVVGYCFTDHRDIVMALLSVMKGLGMLISTPFALYIIGRYGIKGTFIIISGINLNMCVLGLLMKPSALEKHIQRGRKLGKLSESKTVSTNGFWNKLRSTLREAAVVFLDAPFVLFLVGTVAWNVMLAVCIMHLPNFMNTRGDNASHISSVMVCFSISNIGGRLVAAMSLTKTKVFDPLRMCVIGLGIAGVGTITFPLYKHIPYSEYMFVVVAGSLTGLPNALMSPLAIRFMGIEHLSFGLIFFACGIGYIVGPPIASALYKSTGSYDSSFVFAGSVSSAGCLCTFVSLILHRRRSKPTQRLEHHIDVTLDLMNGDGDNAEDPVN